MIEMAALLQIADAFVGNDSGPMHLAGALGVPTIGIFIRNAPDLHHPYGPRAAVVGGDSVLPEPEEVAMILGRLLEEGRTE